MNQTNFANAYKVEQCVVKLDFSIVCFKAKPKLNKSIKLKKKMQNRHSNSAESFQLLQLSDDSKSLSDLELPEVVFQRKRKVRR